jgi:hypothetical protein
MGIDDGISKSPGAQRWSAVQDVLHVCGALSEAENDCRKAVLDRIVAMLTKLGRRGYAVHEEHAEYAVGIPTPTPTRIRDRTVANTAFEATLDSASQGTRGALLDSITETSRGSKPCPIV